MCRNSKVCMAIEILRTHLLTTSLQAKNSGDHTDKYSSQSSTLLSQHQNYLMDPPLTLHHLELQLEAWYTSHFWTGYSQIHPGQERYRSLERNGLITISSLPDRYFYAFLAHCTTCCFEAVLSRSVGWLMTDSCRGWRMIFGIWSWTACLEKHLKVVV